MRRYFAFDNPAEDKNGADCIKTEKPPKLKVKAIKSYIEEQLKKDKESDQLSFFDPRDPFMGSK